MLMVGLMVLIEIAAVMAVASFSLFFSGFVFGVFFMILMRRVSFMAWLEMVGLPCMAECCGERGSGIPSWRGPGAVWWGKCVMGLGECIAAVGCIVMASCRWRGVRHEIGAGPSLRQVMDSWDQGPWAMKECLRGEMAAWMVMSLGSGSP